MPFIGGAIICRSEHKNTHTYCHKQLPFTPRADYGHLAVLPVKRYGGGEAHPQAPCQDTSCPEAAGRAAAGSRWVPLPPGPARSPFSRGHSPGCGSSRFPQRRAGESATPTRRHRRARAGNGAAPPLWAGPGRAGPSRGAVRGLRRQHGGRRCQQCRPLGSRGAAGPSRGSGASARQVRGAALPPGAAAEALRAGPAARPRSGHAGRLRPAALGVTAGPERIGSAPWRPPASAARPPGGDSGSPSRPSSSSAAAASSSSFSARPARARPSRHRRPPVEPGAQPGAARGHDGGAERAAARRRRQGESIARPRSAGPGPERAASPCPRPSPGLSGAASLRAGPRPPAPPPPSPPGEAWSRRQPGPRPARVRPGVRPPAPRGLAAAPAAGRALSRPATAPGWVCGPVALVAAGGGGKARCGGCGRACPPLRTGGRCSCARHAEAEQCV